MLYSQGIAHYIYCYPIYPPKILLFDAPMKGTLPLVQMYQEDESKQVQKGLYEQKRTFRDVPSEDGVDSMKRFP